MSSFPLHISLLPFLKHAQGQSPDMVTMMKIKGFPSWTTRFPYSSQFSFQGCFTALSHQASSPGGLLTSFPPLSVSQLCPMLAQGQSPEGQP